MKPDPPGDFNLNNMETFRLIEKYCEENIQEGFELRDYELNGTIIKLKGYRKYEGGGYDKSFEVELLDYITWLWNSKQ